MGAVSFEEEVRREESGLGRCCTDERALGAVRVTPWRARCELHAGPSLRGRGRGWSKTRVVGAGCGDWGASRGVRAPGLGGAGSAFAAPRSAAWHVFQGLSPERMALPISDTVESISESVERALNWGHASRLRRDRCLHPRSVQPAVAVACPWTLQRGLGFDRAWLWTSQYATESDACWAQARSAALGLYGGARRLSQISLTRPHGRGSPCRAYTLTQYEGAAIGSVQAAQHV